MSRPIMLHYSKTGCHFHGLCIADVIFLKNRVIRCNFHFFINFGYVMNCDESTVWWVGCMTSWPCDELAVWWLDCDDLTVWWVDRVMSWLAATQTDPQLDITTSSAWHWTAGSLFGAVSLCFFVFVRNISQTAERICAKFTRKTCLVPRLDEFEGQGQRFRQPACDLCLVKHL